jgi:hypothetical protein
MIQAGGVQPLEEVGKIFIDSLQTSQRRELQKESNKGRNKRDPRSLHYCLGELVQPKLLDKCSQCYGLYQYTYEVFVGVQDLTHVREAGQVWNASATPKSSCTWSASYPLDLTLVKEASATPKSSCMCKAI